MKVLEFIKVSADFRKKFNCSFMCFTKFVLKRLANFDIYFLVIKYFFEFKNSVH